MNGRGEEAGASELSPWLALLGSSEELRVTDHQTDKWSRCCLQGD